MPTVNPRFAPVGDALRSGVPSVSAQHCAQSKNKKNEKKKKKKKKKTQREKLSLIQTTQTHQKKAYTLQETHIDVK
eukprot:NODE_24051_length_640_cov_2.966862.p2 GENE.NODE_24051_length_640_cov_2.966862~~NODE_24051_length_640_cov_2.966862.p2  ORF type:complete len:76 (+),score=16.76 NODE_24051_length_640_cov_2.966862:380-607(+)